MSGAARSNSPRKMSNKLPVVRISVPVSVTAIYSTVECVYIVYTETGIVVQGVDMIHGLEGTSRY